MNNLSKNVLEQIREEHLKPKPRWEFIMKNYFFWLFFALFAIAGSIAVSVTIFMITDHDWISINISTKVLPNFCFSVCLTFGLFLSLFLSP